MTTGEVKQLTPGDTFRYERGPIKYTMFVRRVFETEVHATDWQNSVHVLPVHMESWWRQTRKIGA
jgi:hypothetical protein